MLAFPARADVVPLRVLFGNRNDRFRREDFVHANDAMIKRVADVDIAVAGPGSDGPAEWDCRLRFFAFRALAIKISVAAKADDFVVCVVTNRDRKRDTVGNIQAAKVVYVETRLRARDVA